MRRKIVRLALSEIGGVTHFESIIDQQEGATCGFEAVENVLQLYVPVDNNVSRTDLLSRAHAYGALWWDGSSHLLDVGAYQQILQDYGIQSHWAPFSHDALIDAVWSNRVAIVVVDGNLLDPRTYTAPNSWHAIMVTNLVTDLTHRTALAYAGADSNFGGQQRFWSVDVLERASTAFPYWSMLVTDDPARWPRHSAHFVQLPNSRIIRGKVK